MQMFRSTVTQLIEGSGQFNDKGLDRFLKEVKFAECGINYTVVAIMGPQSSGKSTLLNHLFHTEFREMNAEDGRSQTTQGIWMAKCAGISPFTIAMDLEGSDGRERGQDDTTFERQSALFALAIADIVLINMWCHDVGREQGASKPLLRTVFQAMMRLFGNHRKTTLLFVLRDKSKTPLQKLKLALLEDVKKIWNEIPRREAYRRTMFRELFSVEVVALSSYENQEEKFKEEVAALRMRFVNSTSPGGLAGDRKGNVTASAFSLSAQNIWKTITDDRDLDLPSHKVMLANLRCEDILNEKLSQLIHTADWLKTKKAAETGVVPDLGKRLGTILSTCLLEYDEETMDFDETVRRSKRELLESKLLDVLYSAFIDMLGHKRFEVFNEFKQKLDQSIQDGRDIFQSVRALTEDSINKFDKGRSDATIENVHWDASSVQDKLRNDIEAHANSKCNESIIQDLKNINLQNQEKSQEQINRIVEGNEAYRKAAEARINQMEVMRGKDQELLNGLQATVTNYEGEMKELRERSKWGPSKLELTGPSKGGPSQWGGHNKWGPSQWGGPNKWGPSLWKGLAHGGLANLGGASKRELTDNAIAYDGPSKWELTDNGDADDWDADVGDADDWDADVGDADDWDADLDF